MERKVTTLVREPIRIGLGVDVTPRDRLSSLINERPRIRVEPHLDRFDHWFRATRQQTQDIGGKRTTTRAVEKSTRGFVCFVYDSFLAKIVSNSYRRIGTTPSNSIL
jgi:hypothetical protein